MQGNNRQRKAIIEIKESKLMSIRSLTNNPLIINKKCPHVESIEGDPLVVFMVLKNEIVKGYKLITHPLTGSIRPDINPYKTVIISDMAGNLDFEGLQLVENAIEYTKSLYRISQNHKWDEASLRDFQLIDFDLIKEFIEYEISNI